MQELDHLSRGVGPSTNELYEALADDRRRTVLRELATREVPVETATLARQVAEAERASAEIGPLPEVVERVHVSLYHVHLPMLAAAGLVEYDTDRDLIVGVADEVEHLDL